MRVGWYSIFSALKQNDKLWIDGAKTSLKTVFCLADDLPTHLSSKHFCLSATRCDCFETKVAKQFHSTNSLQTSVRKQTRLIVDQLELGVTSSSSAVSFSVFAMSNSESDDEDIIMIIINTASY